MVIMPQSAQETVEKDMNPRDVDLALTMRRKSLNINKALGSRRGSSQDQKSKE